MKFSLKSIHTTSNLQNRNLWSVNFADNTPNIIDSAGGVGQHMPASSVTENLFEVSYDNLTLINGIPLPIPQSVSYLGFVNITFNDNGEKGKIQTITNWFINWVDSIHEDNAFNDLSSIVKTIHIHKYDREGSGSVWKSSYLVLPPDKYDFQGGEDVSLSEYSVTLPIVGVLKLQQ